MEGGGVERINELSDWPDILCERMKEYYVILRL